MSIGMVIVSSQAMMNRPFLFVVVRAASASTSRLGGPLYSGFPELVTAASSCGTALPAECRAIRAEPAPAGRAWAAADCAPPEFGRGHPAQARPPSDLQAGAAAGRLRWPVAAGARQRARRARC